MIMLFVEMGSNLLVSGKGVAYTYLLNTEHSTHPYKPLPGSDTHPSSEHDMHLTCILSRVVILRLAISALK